MMNEHAKFLTRAAAARQLNISMPTLCRWIDEKRLPVLYFASSDGEKRSIRIEQKAIDEFIERSRSTSV